MSFNTIPSHSKPLPLDLTIRAGMKLVYFTTQMTPITLLLKPRLDVWQFILEPRVAFDRIRGSSRKHRPPDKLAARPNHRDPGFLSFRSIGAGKLWSN